MINDNYKSWLLNVDDFPKDGTLSEQFKFLVRFAILAPSTHNSQPWQFKIKDNAILIEPNFNRTLPVGDKYNNFLYLSLGCALENLLVAVSHYGFSAEVKYPDDSDKKISITVNKTENAIINSEDLIFYITKRITNRHKFTDKMPESNFLELVKNLKTEDVQVEVVTPGEKNEQIKLLVNRTIPEVLNEKNFRKELSSYVKTNITKSKFGMPAFVMGVPTIPSLIIPTILKFVNLEKFNKKKQDGATNAKIFVVIETKKNNMEDLVKSGQIFQRINLLTTKFGLFTHPTTAPLHNIERRKELQKILQTEFVPQFLFRLGYGTVEVRHSPRMLVDDCLVIV